MKVVKIKGFKSKIIWISGLVLSTAMGLIGWLSYKFCTDDITCILYVSIPLLPGIFLNLEGLISIIVSLLFWFLLGSLIGFLVYKIKKK